MKLKSAYILTFTLLFFVNCFSQQETSTFNLNWNAPIKIDPTSEITALSFDGARYVDDTFLPYFFKTIDVYNAKIDSISISDLKLEPLSAEELFYIGTSKNKIPSEAKITITYATEKKINKAIIQIVPLINNNGDIKKITSFKLKYNLNSANLRSASTTKLHSFSSNSVLASGKWIKISIPTSGIYKITYEDLVSWGVENPANANIYGYGGAMLAEYFGNSKIDDLPQLSVWKDKGADGIFGSGDYMLFYAQGSTSWKYDISNNEFVKTTNCYSDLGYYFISSGGNEKIIENKDELDDSDTQPIRNFIDYQFQEKDLTNLLSSGREWYGDEFNNTTYERNYSFSVPDIDVSNMASIRVNAISSYKNTSDTASKSHITISINDNSTDNITFNQTISHEVAVSGNKKLDFTPTSSNINIKMSYDQPSSGTARLNYITVNAYRMLNITGNAMGFRNPDLINISNKGAYELTGDEGYLIWDITDQANIKNIQYSYNNKSYSFVDSTNTLKEYIAVLPTATFPTPTKVSDVSNQNLHNLSQINYVIIANSDYVSQANILAKKHEDVDGLKTVVVTPEMIYNEFSSGTPDATAYRWFLKMFYDRVQNTEDSLKYVLLFGDGTYDNKGILTKNTKFNKILTYQASNSLNELSSYVSDDYFGLLDDNDGGYISYNLLDIGVGRFPVNTTDQATNIVNKIINYMDNPQNNYWKNIVCYIADDGGDDKSVNDCVTFTEDADLLAKDLETRHPAFQTKRILLDSYKQEVNSNGESYPLAKEKILNLINSGVFLINYTGHGSTESLASEKILTRSDINDLYNKKLPIFVTATCSFSRFDNTETSSGEELFLNNHGGAIGLFSTTRTVLATNNAQLNTAFNKIAFNIENKKPLSLGEIMRRTKNSMSGDENRLNFTLLADPGLRLQIPINKIKTTNITSNSTSGTDTINSLSTVTISGQIEDAESNIISNFNGTLTASVFDKASKIKTLGNNGCATYEYYDRLSNIFIGKTTVTNGVFSLTFMIPKDISYDFGNAHINMYAHDDTQNMTAHGDKFFILGGSKENFIFENIGPNIKLQLNSDKFTNNSSVDANSVLYAQLSDDNGINAGGNGIGHDISISLSNEPNNSIILNDYFETNLNDYKSGKLSYKLPTLDDGSYTLTMKAWDLLNNSGSSTISFNVNSSQKPKLYNCYAYPNPASESVKFIFEHDQPLSKLNMSVDIINLNGEVLWQKSTTDYFDDNKAYIQWDLTTNSGSKITKGLYLYRINVKSTDDNIISSISNKIIIK